MMMKGKMSKVSKSLAPSGGFFADTKKGRLFNEWMKRTGL